MYSVNRNQNLDWRCCFYEDINPVNYTQKITETSKEEAEKGAQLQNSKYVITPNTTTTTKTSWLELETTIAKYSSNTGGASARFEWLTSPFFRGKDALALGLNANCSAIPGSSSALYKYSFYTDTGTLNPIRHNRRRKQE